MDAIVAVHPEAKGQSGRIISIGNIGGPLTVKTSKQSLVARSSTESELICLADGVSEVRQVQRILKFLDIHYISGQYVHEKYG
jgi:lysyl-tRNA synthetase class I